MYLSSFIGFQTAGYFNLFINESWFYYKNVDGHGGLLAILTPWSPVVLADFFVELPQDEKMIMLIPVSKNLKGLSINFTRAQLWLREKLQKIKTF
jgi:hypothetical protein